MLNEAETLRLAADALGTLTQTHGVKIISAILNGMRVAVAVIEGAQFNLDQHGRTILENADAAPEPEQV